MHKFVIIHHHEYGETPYVVSTSITDEEQLLSRFLESGIMQSEFEEDKGEHLSCHDITDEAVHELA